LFVLHIIRHLLVDGTALGLIWALVVEVDEAPYANEADNHYHVDDQLPEGKKQNED
jgi:hypothetical protein